MYLPRQERINMKYLIINNNEIEIRQMITPAQSFFQMSLIIPNLMIEFKKVRIRIKEMMYDYALK